MSPGSNTKITKFNGKNFQVWKHKTAVDLRAHDKDDLWEVVEMGVDEMVKKIRLETELYLENQSDQVLVKGVQEKLELKIKLLKKADSIGLSELNKRIEDTFIFMVKDCKTSHECWRKLCAQYEKRGLANRLFIRRKFYGLRWDGNADLGKYISAFLQSADEVRSASVRLDEDELVEIFLASLHEDYDSLIVALETKDDLTWDYVTTRVLHEESKRREGQKKIDEVALFHRAAAPKGKQPGGGKYQQKTKHKSDGKGKGPKGGCFVCGKDHFASVCPEKHGKDKEESNFHEEEDAWVAEEGLHSEEELIVDCLIGIEDHQDTVTRVAVGMEATVAAIVDSGCTCHMTNRRDLMSNFKPCAPVRVRVGGSGVCLGTGRGDLRCRVKDASNGVKSVVMNDVLYVETLGATLISVKKLLQRGLMVHFAEDKALVMRGQVVLAQARVVRELFRMQIRVKVEEVAGVAAAPAAEPSAIVHWHQRMGHVNFQRLSRMAADGLVVGLPDRLALAEAGQCEVCVLGKKSCHPHRSEGTDKDKLATLEEMSSDVCGPVRISSWKGRKYFGTLKDRKSSYGWVFMMKKKNETLGELKVLNTLFKNQFKHGMQKLRTDNGGEYVNAEFTAWLRAEGIEHQPTAPGNPEMNGMAERMNRTVCEMARCLLVESGLPSAYWAEAVGTSVYTLNRCSTSANSGGVTPHEVLFGEKPRVGHMRRFGCLALVKTSKTPWKFGPKAQRCVLVGYASATKCYRLTPLLEGNRVSGKIIVSRDVTFFEHVMPLQKLRREDSSAGELFPDMGDLEDMGDSSEERNEPAEPRAQDDDSSDDEHREGVVAEGNVGRLEVSERQGGEIEGSGAPARRSGRERTPVVRYDPSCHLAEHLRGCLVQEEEEVAWHADSFEPSSMEEVKKLDGPLHAKWMAAAQEEHASLMRMKTWKLVRRPKGRHVRILPSRWVFKGKKDAFGMLYRYKARFVVKGCRQRYGTDYKRTSSPVIHQYVLRMLVAMAARFGWVMGQADCVCAFLNSRLKGEELYIEQPEGFEDPSRPDDVCMLLGTLYGLKQSPLYWNEEINAHMRVMGYTRCAKEVCLYSKRVGGAMILVGIYVDDLVFFTSSSTALKNAQLEIGGRLEIKISEEMEFVIGIQVIQTDAAVYLCQRQFIVDSLKRHGLWDSKPVLIPFEPGLRLSKDMCAQSEEEKESVRKMDYRGMIGDLLYLSTASRPDICYAVGQLSRFQENPGPIMVRAARRVFRYLKQTLNFGISYEKGPRVNESAKEFGLHAFADASFADDGDNRASTSGYVISSEPGLLTWGSKRQTCIARSSTESELIAVAECADWIRYYRQLIGELGGEFKAQEPTVLYEDNQPCIAMVEGGMASKKSRNIDIKYHCVAQDVIDGTYELKYLATEQQVADMFTKPLPHPQFKKLREMIGVVEIPTAFVEKEC
jgi:transposase InsO family protein